MKYLEIEMPVKETLKINDELSIKLNEDDYKHFLEEYKEMEMDD